MYFYTGVIYNVDKFLVCIIKLILKWDNIN